MAAVALPQAWPARSGRRRARRLPSSVYWRRRAALALLVLGVPAAGASVFLGGGPLTAAEDRTPGAVVELDARPVARSVYVVRSGDTLWTIARRMQPTGDVRPIVDALADARGGRPLQPGERIVLP